MVRSIFLSLASCGSIDNVTDRYVYILPPCNVPVSNHDSSIPPLWPTTPSSPSARCSSPWCSPPAPAPRRGDDGAAGEGLRLGPGDGVDGRRGRRLPLWPDGPFAGALMQSLGVRNTIVAALALMSVSTGLSPADDRALAVRDPVGRVRRHRRRGGGHGAGGDHRAALVRHPPRPGDGRDERGDRHRQPDLPARHGRGGRGRRLAAGGADRHLRHRRADPAGLAAAARAAERPRRAALRRHRGRPAAPPRAAPGAGGDVRGAGAGVEDAHLLAAVRRLLRLRPDHQRPDRRPHDRASAPTRAWPRPGPPACWR
jgi:hypothetical protein